MYINTILDYIYIFKYILYMQPYTYSHWKNNYDHMYRETGVSQHHGGPIEGPLKPPQTIRALSYWGV